MISFDRSMQKKKLKNIIRSRHFSSCFFILSLLSTMLFFVSTLLNIWQNSLQLKEQLEAKADAAYSNIENTFSVMKVGSVFIAKLASVNHILVSPDPTIDYFSRMINDISPYTQLYSFETICLYFDRSERVFDSSGGMYTYSDFYNPDFLRILSEMDTEEAWVVNIPYERYYSPRPAVPVVVYAHSLPLYSSNPKGYITISYAMRELRRDAAALLSDNDNSYHAVVTFCDQLIYATDAALYERWDSSLSADENEALLFPDYNAYPAVQNSNTLQCTYYVSTTEQFKAVTPFLLRRFCEYFFILFCCFLLSAIYSMVLLKPVDDIMEKLGITPYTLGLSDDHDEFFRLNSALDSLTAQVSEVHSVLHEKEQLVRERLLLGILHASVDITALPQEYMKYGLVFPYRFFSLILIHMPALEIMEDFTKKKQLRLVVLSSASEAFSVLGKAYGIHTNGQNIGILLNTSIAEAELTAELKRLCSAISQRMQQTLSIDPFFSIVLCEQASPSYQKSWQLARRNLLFTSPETEDFMIIGHQEDLTSSLDPNLSIQLSRALIDRDQAVAHKIADSFFSRYLETANTQEARKLTTILLCEVYVALLDFGDDIPDTQLSPYLKKLENAADPSECSRIFFSCIQGLLNAKTKTSMEAHTYICQAISYIQQHYREELSVPQIADAVGLNPVYLSRLFKLDTGKTLSEYLNCYRTECSLALLADTADTIQSISQKVGYSDVRSYIRFFKKYYDATPSEYRRGAVGK